FGNIRENLKTPSVAKAYPYLRASNRITLLHPVSPESMTERATGETVTARQIGKLTPAQIKRAKQGWNHDGGGLYLRGDPDGGKYWFFRFGAHGGKYLALGPLHTISLQRAREKAREARELLIDGRDPKKERAAARAEALRAASFAEVADRCFDNHKAAWGPKYAREWRLTLRTYAEPILGQLPVTAVDTNALLRVLEPLWSSKPQAASRLRAPVEMVLDFAKSRGLRDGDNPARWRGHLANLLPKVSKVVAPKHHAALPYADLPAFMRELRAIESTAARCLEFVIL